MKPHRIASFPQTAVAVDFETDLIQPGLNAPPPVCAGVATPGGAKTVLADEALEFMREVFADERWTYVNSRACFDVIVAAAECARRGIDVMPDVFRMYDPTGGVVRGDVDGRVVDPLVVEQLHHVAQGHLTYDPLTSRLIADPGGDSKKAGSYTHDAVTMLVTGKLDAKVNDRFRKRYYEFRHIPFDQWPFEARQYPADDAIIARDNALRQLGHAPAVYVHKFEARGDKTICVNCGQELTRSGPPPECMIIRPRRNLHEVSRRCYFSLAAALGDAWGFRIDQKKVDELDARFGPEHEEAGKRFVEAGIVREDGSENTSVLKRLVAIAYGSGGECAACAGTGRVPSEKTQGKTKVACKTCDGTGLALSSAVPRTEKGSVQSDRDALQESGDDLLSAYQEHGEGEKIRTTFIPLLRRGRACNVCGETGAGKVPHKDWCTAPDGSAGYREVPLLPSTRELVETGRCAVRGGLHSVPRKGIWADAERTRKIGVRECFVARPGYVFSSEDYTAGELVTLSEVCLRLVGFSKLGEALNNGLDAHLQLAGVMTGRDYEVMKALKDVKDKKTDDDRQAAKAGNFGFGGGMAELTFTIRKRSDPDLFTYGEFGPDEDAKGKRGWKGLRTCVLMDGAARCGFDAQGRSTKVLEYNERPTSPVCLACVKAALRLKGFWLKCWPEMKPFFDKVKKLIADVGPSGTAEIIHLGSHRIRGGVGFCDGANGLFQGLLADAATDAYCQIQRECCDRSWRVRSSEMMTSQFDGLESPLYGSRAIMLMHDEPLCEHPESVAHEAAHRVSEIMVETLRFRCPGHAKAVKAEPTLMRSWIKSAEARWARGDKKPADASDRLIPYEDAA